MERISDKPNADRYDRMIERREQDIIKAREQIESYRDMDAAFKKRRSESKKSIELLDEIITTGGISDAHLRMLVDKIIITDAEGRLEIEICLKAAFRQHYDIYDDFLVLVESLVEIQAGDYIQVESVKKIPLPHLEAI